MKARVKAFEVNRATSTPYQSILRCLVTLLLVLWPWLMHGHEATGSDSLKALVDNTYSVLRGDDSSYVYNVVGYYRVWWGMHKPAPSTPFTRRVFSPPQKIFNFFKEA